MVLAPGRPIPHGRPYRYHLNGMVHMMTMKKRVRPLPTHRLVVRNSVDYSSSDHFSSDDSLRDSSSSSSSETSSDSSADALSDSASSRSSFDHSLHTPSSGMRPSHHLCSLVPSIHRSSAAISDRPSHDSSSASPSRKRSISPATSVPLSLPTLGALSYAHANLLPSPKSIRSPESAMDLEGCLEDIFELYVPRETRLGVDFVDESSELFRFKGTDLEMDVDVIRSNGIDIDPKIQAEIDECFAYADALRDRGVDARVVVEAIDREEIETGIRGPVKVRVDRVTHPVVVDDVPKPAQKGVVEVTYKTLGDLVQRTMPNTLSGASRTCEGLNEQIDHQMVGVLGACTTARNLEPLIRDEGGQEEVNGNGGNGNGGNGNRGNGNGMAITSKDLCLLENAIRVANNLMDQKLKGYARSAKNKRRLDNMPRDNRGQQPVFKRQNVGGHNVARAYRAGNNEKKWYVGSLPYCNKCKLHHAGPCTVRCGNCKRVGHITRDCTATITLNTQRAPIGN
ncbi:putative reverse transcriptase domain-containing protein [Tanacetum coccineum]